MRKITAPISKTHCGKEQGVLAEFKQHALQTAINDGHSSGDAGALDIDSIKALARSIDPAEHVWNIATRISQG